MVLVFMYNWKQKLVHILHVYSQPQTSFKHKKTNMSPYFVFFTYNGHFSQNLTLKTSDQHVQGVKKP